MNNIRIITPILDLFKIIIDHFYHDGVWNQGLIAFTGLMIALIIPIVKFYTKYRTKKLNTCIKSLVLEFEILIKRVELLGDTLGLLRNLSISNFLVPYRNYLSDYPFQPMDFFKLVHDVSVIDFDSDFKKLLSLKENNIPLKNFPYEFRNQFKSFAVVLGFAEMGYLGSLNDIELTVFKENLNNLSDKFSNNYMIVDFLEIKKQLGELSNLLSQNYKLVQRERENEIRRKLKVLSFLHKYKKNDTSLICLKSLDKKHIKNLYYWANKRQKKMLKYLEMYNVK